MCWLSSKRRIILSIADECGVDDSDAQDAVCWASDALMATLRKKDRRLRPRPNRR
jgi:hypothetical protein